MRELEFDPDQHLDFRGFVEQSHDMQCVAGTDGYFYWLNSAWERELGWTPDEMMERSFLDLVHPDDLEPTLNEVATLAEGTPTIQFTNRYLHKDGHWLWIEWITRPDDNGFLYAIARNVTAYFDAQAEARRRLEMLNLAERMAQIGHWRVDLDRNEVFWSAHVYRIHGRDPETYTPTLEEGIDAYHPDDRELVGAAVQRSIDEGVPFSFKLRLVRTDGAIRTVLSFGHPEVDSAGRVTSIFGVFQDVTDSEEDRQAERQQASTSSQVPTRQPPG